MATQRPLVYDTGDVRAIAAGDTIDPTWLPVGGGGSGPSNVLNARVASVANVVIAIAVASYDNITMSNGDDILLKNQTTPAENGLYTFNGVGSALTRSTLMAAASVIKAGLLVTVSEGTVNYDSMWMLTSNGSHTVGTTAMTFSTSVPSYKEFTIDFGTSRGIRAKKFSIAYPGLLAGQRVDINASGYTPTGVYFDESEFEAITYVGKCLVNGTLLVIANSTSAVRKQRIIQVTLRG